MSKESFNVDTTNKLILPILTTLMWITHLYLIGKPLFEWWLLVPIFLIEWLLTISVFKLFQKIW